jgi:hypothetical protein
MLSPGIEPVLSDLQQLICGFIHLLPKPPSSGEGCKYYTMLAKSNKSQSHLKHTSQSVSCLLAFEINGQVKGSLKSKDKVCGAQACFDCNQVAKWQIHIAKVY